MLSLFWCLSGGVFARNFGVSSFTCWSLVYRFYFVGWVCFMGSCYMALVVGFADFVFLCIV